MKLRTLLLATTFAVATGGIAGAESIHDGSTTEPSGQTDGYGLAQGSGQIDLGMDFLADLPDRGGAQVEDGTRSTRLESRAYSGSAPTSEGAQ